MDLPIFHLDWLNDRVLIGVIAVLHVLVNHALAVGGIPLVVWLERRGMQTRDPYWDDLAYRLLRVFFIVTTTVGALTGVGIWLSAALVNPYAIGSLLRVFFWAWLTEWVVFVTEVSLILAYFLTWKRWTGERKRRHLRLGVGLAVASWLTMAIIVSILGFMMDPGSWAERRTLLSGFANPMYLPQLALRTPLAMLMAGAAALVVVAVTEPRGSERRAAAIGSVSRWLLAWLAPCVGGASLYIRAVPREMRGNLPTALLTQELARWAEGASWALAATACFVAAIAAWGALAPARVRGWALVFPAVALVVMVGMFERVREFVRKPYAIAGYMYSNGVRVEDYPLLRRDGVLAHATYRTARGPSARPDVEEGREVFLVACSRCHTSDGVNGLRGHMVRLYGADQPWDPDLVATYVGSMHAARPYMPPFPGNDAELRSLAAWLATLRLEPAPVDGAQIAGVRLAASATPPTLLASP